jgi:hypothetical protein
MAKTKRKETKPGTKAEGGIEITAGALFKERTSGVKFPRIIRVRKIEKMGPLDYVFYMAENQAAQAAHPNGGFTPKSAFLQLWQPADSNGS